MGMTFYTDDDDDDRSFDVNSVVVLRDEIPARNNQ